MRPWAQNRWRGQNRLPPFKSKTDGTARTERQLQRESQFAKIVNRTVLIANSELLGTDTATSAAVLNRVTRVPVPALANWRKSKLRSRYFFNSLREQMYRIPTLVRREPRHVEQPIPVIAEVFQALQTIEKPTAPALRKYTIPSASLTVISAISGSVNDSPKTYPTTAAIRGDIPGKRAGFNLFVNSGTGTTSLSETFLTESEVLIDVL
jgi:hypothetical protein